MLKREKISDKNYSKLYLKLAFKSKKKRFFKKESTPKDIGIKIAKEVLRSELSLTPKK